MKDKEKIVRIKFDSAILELYLIVFLIILFGDFNEKDLYDAIYFWLMK